jgi:hypothetical protein
MTVKQVIAMVESLIPNTVDPWLQVKWLGNLEKTMYQDIYQTHHGTDRLEPVELNGDSDMELVLSADAPYDEIYRWYLEMKICEVMGEIERLNNAAAKYNAAMIAYMDYINRKFMPKGLSNIRIV